MSDVNATPTWLALAAHLTKLARTNDTTLTQGSSINTLMQRYRMLMEGFK